MQSLFASGFNNYWEFPLNQMALKPLLLGLSMLRDGIMKGSCCDYEGFVLRTASVVLTRKVSPKSKKGGWWLWERWHVLCDPWRTGRNMLWKSDFHPWNLRLSSLLSLSFMGAPFQELLFQGPEIGNKILSFQKVLLQLSSTSTKSLKTPIYIDSSRGGSKIFYFHLTSTFLKRERIESLKALKCWFTGTKVGV